MLKLSLLILLGIPSLELLSVAQADIKFKIANQACPTVCQKTNFKFAVQVSVNSWATKTYGTEQVYFAYAAHFSRWQESYKDYQHWYYTSYCSSDIMNNLSHKILDIALENVPAELRDESIIFWNQTLFRKGDNIHAGQREHTFPFCGYHVFVDLMPQANWGHPVLHLFIDEYLENVKVIKDQFPPWFDDLPESVVVLYRYGSIPKDKRDPDPFGVR